MNGLVQDYFRSVRQQQILSEFTAVHSELVDGFIESTLSSDETRLSIQLDLIAIGTNYDFCLRVLLLTSTLTSMFVDGR